MTPRARPAVQMLSPYVCARDLYKQGDVLLDANENAFASASLAGVKLNRYPDPDATELREALAEYCGAGNEQLLVGNGSDEIIALAINAFCEASDNVIAVEPGYSMYGVCARAAGVESRQAVLTPDFQLEAARVMKLVDSRTRVVFVVSPNSAVGALVEEKQIRLLLESFSGIVFVDEAYCEFAGKSIVNLVGDYDNLIVSRTLSKAWGLAALRVGYCISQEENIAALRKVKLPYNVSGLSQALAAKAVRSGKQAMLESVERIAGERQKLTRELSRLGLRVFPSVANFVTVRFPPGIDSKLVQSRLAEKRIIIRDRSTLPLLENCGRITVGTPEENKLLLRELRSILLEMRK